MVLACNHKTQIVLLDFVQQCSCSTTAQYYIGQVLQQIVLPFIAVHQGTVLQHNNARPHAARLTQNFLATNDVKTLPWPGLPPNLSPKSMCSILNASSGHET